MNEVATGLRDMLRKCPGTLLSQPPPRNEWKLFDTAHMGLVRWVFPQHRVSE